MNAAANDGGLDEASLLKLYMDLAGTSEASARSVYMFVCSEEAEKEQKSNELARWRTEKSESQTVPTKDSPARTESGQEFGIGLLETQTLPVTGK